MRGGAQAADSPHPHCLHRAPISGLSQCGYRQVAVHEIEVLSESRDFCYGVVALIELAAVALTVVTGTTIIDVYGLPKEVPLLFTAVCLD